MKKKLHLLSALLCLILLGNLQAQDIHLSHIHASPTLLNPAMTGLFNGDIRFIGNARSQWQSVTKGYTTAVAEMDVKILSLRSGDVMGGGLMVYTDKAGDLDFKTNHIGLSLSYLKSLNGRGGGNYVSFGLQAAQVTNSLDYSKIIAFDYEPSIQEGASDRVSYFDVTAGVTWFLTLNRNFHFHLGTSAAHLNQPIVSFWEDDELTPDHKLFRKLTFHGGGDINLSRKSSLKPSFIFKDQGPHRQITLGSFYKYKTTRDLSNSNASSLYFGAWVRWHAETDFKGVDAAVIALRFDHKNTFLTFTFDVNISSLTKVSYGAGGPEFSVVQILDFKRGSRRASPVECPAFSY